MRKHRASERGAALFIVVMVVTLLTAIGAFAVHGASLAQTASGYSRRSNATFYLGEFGMNIVASDLQGKESEYLQLALTGKNDCRANNGLPALLGSTATILPCLAREFNQMKTLMNPALVADTDGAVFGALSRPDHPDDQSINATFRVEMTDVQPAPNPQAGAGMTGSAVTTIWQSMFTTTARMVPKTANDCSPEATRASDNQSMRGLVVFTTLGQPPPGAFP